MKEQNKFELHQYERDALSLFIGKIVQYYFPEKNEVKAFKELRKELTEEELEQLSLTYDFLDDCFTYKTIKSHQLKNDMPVLKKVLKWADEHEMFENDWNLGSVAEVILNY